MAATRLALVRDNVRSRLADDVQGVLVGDGRGVFGRLRAERLRGKPLDAVMRVVRVALAAYAGEATPPEYRQLLDLSERLCGGAGIAKLTLGGCVLAPPPARMALPATDVLIWRETGRLSTDGVPLAAGHFIDWDGGRFKVAASAEAAGAVMVRPLGRPGWQDLRRRVASLRLHQFPTGAAETLPAIWDAAGLVAVPALVGAGPGQPPLDPSALQDWESALGPRWRHYNATFTGDAVALEAMGAGRGGP